jgi:hypothetical protein
MFLIKNISYTFQMHLLMYRRHECMILKTGFCGMDLAAQGINYHAN